MRPSQILRSGGGPEPGKDGCYIGTWGNMGSRPQKGIIYFGVSPNRQNPFAGAFHDAIFNTWRRSKNQVLFWAPPVIVYYMIASWALERNHYLYSKAGKDELAASQS